MKKLAPEISVFVLIAFLNMIIGCNYYRVRTIRPAAGALIPGKIEQKLTNKKYVILHQGENVWHLKDIALNDDKKEMTGVIEPLSPDHLYYTTAKIPGTNRYKYDARSPQKSPTYEVHIYISEYAEGQNSQITVPVSSIKKIELYDQDVATTVLTVVGVLAATLVVLIVIILLTKSSCPFVYVSDGQFYHFTGEMYGGAIFPSLERDDYMPLPSFTTANGQFQLKISNELLEKQYTNLAELMVVGHPNDIKVLLDKNGSIQTLQSPVSPLSALSNNAFEYANTILSKDSSAYLFDEADAEDLSGLTLTFKRPLHSTSGKLILNAKNSFWLDYVYGKFNEQFGTYFNTYAEKQGRVSAKKNNQWSLDQGIPLSVYVETVNGWEFVDYFNVVGPLASRDLVMPVDLTKVKGEDVKIKLQCGFMFWEIDYASMDFSENIPLKINRLIPSSAIDEKGREVSSLLSMSDDKYLIQPEVGNEVVVRYSLPVSDNHNRQTTFLHSRGYYEYIRDYKNRPNFFYLNSFKKKGAFTRFSKERYFQFVNSKDLFANALN